MSRSLDPCLKGQHIPSRRSVRQIDPASQELLVSCSRCGQGLLKSPVTGRWRQTGLMG